MTANDYLDYDLKAAKPVNRYTADFKTVADTVPAGSIVGKIYSWTTDSTGQVWWQLYETWKPGFNMWVRHDAAALIPIAPASTVINVTTPGVFTDLLGGNPLDSLSNFFKSGAMLLVAGGVALYFITRKK